MPPESFSPAPADRSVRAGHAAASRVPDGLAARWAALHEAAAVVAGLAGRSAGPLDGAVRGFPAAIAQAGGQRLAVARQGLDDLSAMLETGLRALLKLHGAGADPRPAAAALSAEFLAARDALVTLAPPGKRLLG